MSDQISVIPGFLRPIDTAKIAKQLKLSQEGSSRGAEELPKSASTVLDDVEQTILQKIQGEWAWQGDALIRNLRAYAERLVGYSVSATAAALHLKATNAQTQFENASVQAEGSLGPLREYFIAARDELQRFQSQQRLERPARTPTGRWTTLGLLVILISVESVLNGTIFAKGSDSVAVGGKDNGKPSMRIPLNTILYGPPGTGKTFATVNLALEIMDPHFLKANHSDRKALKLRFDELSKASNVRFVTFHQSFSYEDFVEELQAETDEDGNIRYIVREGVFKSLCNVAAARVTQKIDATIDITGRRIWKMSLGNIHGSDAYIFDECIKNGYALLGYGEDIDFSGCKSRDEVFERFKVAGDSAEKGSYPVTAVTTFLLNIQKGDLLVVTDGNTKFRAIGEVTGEYKRLKRDDEQHKYGQCRAVKWLRVYEPSLPFDTLMSNQFSQMTLYRLRPPAIDLDKLAGLLGASTPDSIPEKATDAAVFRVGEKFNTGYEVAYTSPDIVELIKPNKNRLPIGMSVLCTLADLVQQGTITLDDIKEKRVFDKSSNTSLEPYIVNGYENILASLVERLLSRGAVRPDEKPLQHPSNPKVLIIDEINRGNVSRIFGELITLVEGSKRLGAPEALEVTLPYSKERFRIPAELYLIGTMNTADRSLTGLDIALRRRFRFIEMPPRPEDLKDIDIDGLSIATLLSVVNDRLEILLDRDHKIGHTYFLPLRDDRASCPDISPSAVSASTGILFRGLVQNSTGP
jgi:5-methylcytosine-specific restriction enzyme B